MGEAWGSLTEDEKEVFNSRVFAHFSKLQIPYKYPIDETEGEENEKSQTKEVLDKDKVALYQPLYEKLVNHKKVEFISSQGNEIKDSSILPQALKDIIHINSDLSQ